MELGFLKNLSAISKLYHNTGLNVIGIISLNLATALSGRHLENEFCISGIYSDNEKWKVIKLWSDRIELRGSTVRCSILTPYDNTRSSVWLQQWVGWCTHWRSEGQYCKYIFWFSFNKIAFDDNDLMFKSPHSKVFVTWVVAEVVLICIRFLCRILPLLLFIINYNIILT